jgi:hypothetical protein
MPNNCVNNLIYERQQGSFFVATLSFLKSTQIFNIPFLGGTTTIGDSQVISSTSLIKLVANNMSMSCLTMEK